MAFSRAGFGNERNLRTMMGLLALYHNRITDRSYGLEYAAGWRRTEPSYRQLHISTRAAPPKLYTKRERNLDVV